MLLKKFSAHCFNKKFEAREIWKDGSMTIVCMYVHTYIYVNVCICWPVIGCVWLTSEITHTQRSGAMLACPHDDSFMHLNAEIRCLVPGALCSALAYNSQLLFVVALEPSEKILGVLWLYERATGQLSK